MKPGRNDPCPCGSGRKYKHCCLAKDTAPSSNELLWRRLRRDLDGLLPELLAESVRHFGRTGLRIRRMLASCGRRLAFFVLHLMHEQTMFSHVVFPP